MLFSSSIMIHLFGIGDFPLGGAKNVSRTEKPCWRKLKQKTQESMRAPPSYHDKTGTSRTHLETIVPIVSETTCHVSLIMSTQFSAAPRNSWQEFSRTYTRCMLIIQYLHNTSVNIRKAQQCSRIPSLSSLRRSRLPSTSSMKLTQKAGEHQKPLHPFDSDGWDVAYLGLKENTNPELYLKFSNKVSSDWTAMDFTWDYDLNLLLTWCLWTWVIECY